MKNKIELTIEHKTGDEIELTNKNGDTFSFSSKLDENLADFFKVVKKLSIHNVNERSICCCGNPKVIHHCQNCKGEIQYSNGR